MLTIVRAFAEVALIVAVQAWMLVQVSFGYWRLCARARRAAATPVAAAPLPGDALLSVVIPAYREAATIEATLRRVLSAAADPRRVEVVVVDAGGGDGTMAAARAELPFAVMEATVALRSRVLQLPFGDQALALRRDTFEALGGFDDLAKLPILEDFLLVHKLRVAGARGFGTIANLSTTAHCHPRRWLAKPVWRVNWTNQRVMVLFTYFGYTPLDMYEPRYGARRRADRAPWRGGGGGGGRRRGPRGRVRRLGHRRREHGRGASARAAAPAPGQQRVSGSAARAATVAQWRRPATNSVGWTTTTTRSVDGAGAGAGAQAQAARQQDRHQSDRFA
ncbi:hypothetical protein JL721_6010 [Aureococcus anophagefferens]|nr:hypothetical protein JL721_6010 [Aureococcus anophagefferens]